MTAWPHEEDAAKDASGRVHPSPAHRAGGWIRCSASNDALM
jgi:hypothetical protein